MLRTLPLFFLPPALAALFAAPPVLAQAVEGTVVEQASGKPVAGAVVHLLGAEDRLWRSVLTGEDSLASADLLVRRPEAPASGSPRR